MEKVYYSYLSDCSIAEDLYPLSASTHCPGIYQSCVEIFYLYSNSYASTFLFSWFLLIHSFIFFLAISFVLLLLLMIALTLFLGIQLLLISPSSELLFFQSCKNDPSLLLRALNSVIHAYKKALSSNLTNLISTQKSQTLYCEAVLTHYGSVGQCALLKIVVLCSYFLSFLFCLLLFLIPSFCLCYIDLVACKNKQTNKQKTNGLIKEHLIIVTS